MSNIHIRPLRVVQREHILKAFDHCDQSIYSAAAMLEIDPRTLYRMLDKLGIQQPKLKRKNGTNGKKAANRK